MSDDELEMDMDSDDSGDGTRNSGSDRNIVFHSQEERRAHHNALERKRRDHIKDSFSCLRDTIPSMQGEKVSRAQILKKASEYIAYLRKRNGSHQVDIEDLKRQNEILEEQILMLEKMKAEQVRIHEAKAKMKEGGSRSPA